MLHAWLCRTTLATRFICYSEVVYDMLYLFVQHQYLLVNEIGPQHDEIYCTIYASFLMTLSSQSERDTVR